MLEIIIALCVLGLPLWWYIDKSSFVVGRRMSGDTVASGYFYVRGLHEESKTRDLLSEDRAGDMYNGAMDTMDTRQWKKDSMTYYRKSRDEFNTTKESKSASKKSATTLSE